MCIWFRARRCAINVICWSMKITKNSGVQKVEQLELVLEDTNPLQVANDPALIS